MFEADIAIMTSTRPPPASDAPRQDWNGRLRAIAERADRQAFADLYDHFAPRVKGYLIRGGAAAELAEDLAQETMIKVWRKAALFDPAKASAPTWIFSIARNARIDAARRAARPGLDPDDPTLQPAAEPRADETMEQADRDERIRAAFDRLPPNQQRVVEAHFNDDLPHSEIAARFDLPLGTVKSRLRLAFDKIRKDLEDLDA